MSFLQGQFNPLLVFLAILVFLVILVIIFCEDIKVSQTAQYEGARLSEVKYPVAVSNRLFKDSEIIKDLPCQHCNLISMGEMACYQEFCPTCGRIPTNMTKPIKKVDFLTEETKMSQPRLTKVKYSVAISNRLFKDSEIGKDLPCQHCNMITIGRNGVLPRILPRMWKNPTQSQKARILALTSIQWFTKTNGCSNFLWV